MQRALAGISSNLPSVADVAVENIGAGVGLVATILRCHLSYRDDPGGLPETLIVKLASPHPETFQTARRLQLYRREYDYYRLLGAHVPLRSPTLFYGDFDDSTHHFVLVLEDLNAMVTVDQIDGASEAQARTAVRALARLHGHYWNLVDRPPVSGFHDPASPERRRLVQNVYQASLPTALDRFGSLFSHRMQRLAREYGDRLIEHMDALAAGPLTFCHGDFRLDNMFFAEDGSDDFAAVDWQVCGVRSGLYDVAYFLSSSVSTPVRRRIERSIIEEYHRIIRQMGAGDLTADDCWRSYRQNMLSCFQTPIIAGGQLDFSDTRSSQLADVFLTRTLTAIDDLGADEFLPDGPPVDETEQPA